MQPQLKEILRAHLRELGIAGGLLFPSPVRDGEMVVELRKQLDAVAERAGWKPGEIRTKAFRHTYCAARLQTLDGGAPISPFTVAREMGHGGMALVNRVYGHSRDGAAPQRARRVPTGRHRTVGGREGAEDVQSAASLALTKCVALPRICS